MENSHSPPVVTELANVSKMGKLQYVMIYFNEYSTTRAVEGGTMVESEIWTGAPVRTLRPVVRSEAISA